MKKTLPIFIIIVVLIGVICFFGGMQLSKGKSNNNFANLSPQERQQRIQQMGFGTQGGNRANGANMTTGEIISQDAQSITIKMPDGGSKIVFYSATTEVGKFVDGTSSDLEIGKTVVVSGTSNSDGSITAKSVQIRPTTIMPQLNQPNNQTNQ